MQKSLISLKLIMKTTDNQSDKNINYHRSRIRKSIPSIGEIIFFDYSKNKFGMIGQIKNAVNVHPSKARIGENDLLTTVPLKENDIVFFELNEGERGFYGKNIRRIIEVSQNEFFEILHFLPPNAVFSVLTKMGDDNILNLPDERKTGLSNFLVSIKDPNAWRYISLLGLTSADDYFNIHFPVQSPIALEYIKKAFQSDIFFRIGESTDRWSKLTLLEYLQYSVQHQIPFSTIHQNFWRFFVLHSYTYKELEPFCKESQPSFRDRLLQAIPFNSSLLDFDEDSIDEIFGKVTSLNGLTETDKAKLKVRFSREHALVKFQSLLDLYITLQKYEVFNSAEELMSAVRTRKLQHYEIVKLLSIGINGITEDDFETLLKDMSPEMDLRYWLEIAHKVTNADLAGIVFAKMYTGRRMNGDFVKLFIKELNKVTPTALYKFIDRRKDEMVTHLPGFLAIFSARAKHIEGLRLAVKIFRPKTELDLGRFINEVKANELQVVLGEFAPELAALCSCEIVDGCFQYSKPILDAMSLYRRSAESYLIKWLIQKVHEGALSQEAFLNAVNDHRWLTVSALIMQSVINLADPSEAFMLKTLSKVLQLQFQRLHELELDGPKYLEMFTIGGILTKCHGRTQYNFEKKEVNGESRMFIPYEEPDIRKKEPMSCFCEGRMWLQEKKFVTERTGKETAKSYNLYWCKGQHCAKLNDSVNLENDFSAWTLYDISKVLNLNISGSSMTTMAGWANRMNSITERLICRKCKSVLRPLPFEPGILGQYAVPIFNCINTDCTECNRPIRFTHCLNGKCAITLDSRDNESCCKSGMRCHNCGTSCPRCHGQRPVRAGMI